MSLNPKNIAVQVALRTLQLKGTDQSALDESYLAGYVTLDGAEVPILALIDAVVASEGRLADLIGGDRQNPYRSSLYARSADLISDVPIPTISQSGLPFIGIFSQVNDAVDHKPLTEGSVQEITRYRRGSYSTMIRKYALTASRFYHTRPNAYIEGCAWSRQLAIGRMDVDSIQLSPLPEAFESIWVAMTISYLAQEGWLGNEASYYAQFAQTGLVMMKTRGTDAPTLPAFTATANPISN